MFLKTIVTDIVRWFHHGSDISVTSLSDGFQGSGQSFHGTVIFTHQYIFLNRCSQCCTRVSCISLPIKFSIKSSEDLIFAVSCRPLIVFNLYITTEGSLNLRCLLHTLIQCCLLNTPTYTLPLLNNVMFHATGQS